MMAILVISDTISFSKITTRIDECTKNAAYTTGVTIGKMHNANIIHGDLTTSNILIRNPQDAPPGSASSTSTSSSTSQWKPDVVLIDFGLSSTSSNTKKISSHEERAVDLYVLERRSSRRMRSDIRQISDSIIIHQFLRLKRWKKIVWWYYEVNL